MKSVITEETNHAIEESLFQRFGQAFRFRLAVTEKDRERVFALRHEVFCRELNYNMSEDRRRHLERDIYDASSIHCLVEHEKSGIAAACLRLVIPEEDDNSPLYKLPVEIHSKHSLNHDRIQPGNFPRKQLCEVSRLAISRIFRDKESRKEGSPTHIDNDTFSPEETKTFPLIAIGLFLTTYALVGMTGRRHVFAMMEPRLPRLLSLSGFHFTKVGDTIEFHGKRNAFYIDHLRAEQEMHDDLLPLYLHIQQQLAPQLSAAMPKEEHCSTP